MSAINKKKEVIILETNVRGHGLKSQQPLIFKWNISHQVSKDLCCIHTSFPMRSRVRGHVRVFNISRGFNHQLKHLIELVPGQCRVEKALKGNSKGDISAMIRIIVNGCLV